MNHNDAKRTQFTDAHQSYPESLLANREPLVSVVVPAYNEEKYLGACLHALLRQEHPGFTYEIIVVDDGSTDGTREIALAHGVHVISQPNRGVAAARQAGFCAARGEIIASTDADSCPYPGWLARACDRLSTAPDVVAVYGPFCLHDSTLIPNLCARYLVGLHIWLNDLVGQPALSGSNFAVRRTAWLRSGGFNVRLVSAEDLDLTLKLKAIGRIAFDWRLVMPTSARRTREGYAGLVVHSLSNYMRVMWFGKTPLPFTNIR